MAAPTEYFVDPATGTDDLTGDRGTVIGNPWLTVQFALDNITQNATDGDRVNLKSGTADVLAAGLNLTTYGAPTSNAPLFFRGYTSTQGDGGIGDLDGDATFSILDSQASNSVHFRDMHLHNTGAAIICRLGSRVSYLNCEIDGSTGAALTLSGGGSQVVGCYLHDLGNIGVDVISCLVWNNYFSNVEAGDTNEMTRCISMGGTAEALIMGNIFNIDGSTIGIGYDEGYIINNTFYGNGGANTVGFSVGGTSSGIFGVLNNYFEGLGVGADLSDTTDTMRVWGYNYFYNNDTDVDTGADIDINLSADVILGSSGVANAAGGDFSPTALLKNKAFPQTFPATTQTSYPDVGAIQGDPG